MGGRIGGIEQGLFIFQFGGAGNLIEADIVGTALHDGEGRFLLQVWLEGLGQAWKIAFHQLTLQGQGSGRHDNGAAGFLGVLERRHEVSQRFTGTGACLYREVALLL